MASVIRVKRLLDEEPSNALVVSCKKRKTDNSDEKLLSTVLKFAGTLKNQDEDIYPHLITKNGTKAELEDDFKKRHIDISTKLRDEKLLESKKSRFKIVNFFRSSKPQLESELTCTSSIQDEELIIYDIETTNRDENIKNDDYVYDLYYTSSDDLGDAYLEEYVSIYPLSDNFMHGSMRDDGVDKMDSADDSEDSNAENNWRNDYPEDESDADSINETDMVAAMRRVDLDLELSSDDGEEGFVYSIDSEAAGFEEDIDKSDVQRYGERYARFKAIHKQNKSDVISKDLYYGDIDDDEEDSS